MARGPPTGAAAVAAACTYVTSTPTGCLRKSAGHDLGRTLRCAPMLEMVRRLFGRTGGFADPVRNLRASEFEVDLWELSRFVLERCVPVIAVHPYPLNEQILAAAAACRLRPGVIFDWGTHHGHSTSSSLGMRPGVRSRLRRPHHRSSC